MENILGVDIGGSKIKMILWDGHKILKEWRAEQATLENLKNGLKFFNAQKIGIGAPGLLHKFQGLNLKQCFKAEIKVDNDAKCFLRSEIAMIKGKKPENVLGVIFGTGIGGAINGYYGNNNWAGEFGHMIISKNKSWEKFYQETKNKPEEQEKVNAIGLANLINIFNPSTIILGGAGAKRLSVQGAKLLASHLLLPKKQMPKFITAKLKDNSVAIGAAMLWD